MQIVLIIVANKLSWRHVNNKSGRCTVQSTCFTLNRKKKVVGGRRERETGRDRDRRERKKGVKGGREGMKRRQ